MAKLDLIKKDSYLNKFLDRITEIGKMEGQSKQMQEMLNLADFLEQIWIDGYNAGQIEIVKQNPLLKIQTNKN